MPRTTMLSLQHYTKITAVSLERRLRCAGHIIKLVVKAILYGEGISGFNKVIISCSDSEVFEL